MGLDREELKGTIPAIVTPFSADGSQIDTHSLGHLISYVMGHGCSGIVACGSTGEAMTLTDDEYQKVVTTAAAAVRSYGKGFCIAGIGGSSTARAAAIAESLGSSVDGILLVAPPYNKPPQEGILAHFEAVHRVARVPIIAYNVPGRSAVNILPKTIATMVERKLIIGVKESSGSIDQVTDIASLVGEKISILSGEDSLVHPTMALGGRGVVTVVGNIIPEAISAMTSAALSGDWERSRKLQFDTLPMTRAAFMETNPIPIKTALALKGIISHAALRLPLVPAQRETVERLRQLLGV